ncbi:ABC transporter ATP-binding protein [Shewanella maritima]|uniref:ABC transporter ATP-binding protein n=1 Tax=Shewanella maritima TaxID=2520507 RepID=A0A411PE18_9GAMM|nr:ABC transporter ATP-binding protein [Shewanella maritima]QBF81702.1 ABC transporter ATP-binding protein [Shewanella maritima]
MSSLAINIQDLSYRYKQANSPQFHIPQWQVPQGQSVFLHGDSGTGKSTLLNLLSGVLTPQSGSIEIMGQALTTMKASQRDKFRANHIGVVFQTFNLIPYLTVLENIKLAHYFADNKGDISAKASELVEALKLPAGVLTTPVSQLSIGQQQRVAIVRALINSPDVLLVDEPTSALDASARDAFLTLLVEMTKSSNTCLIFVSHDSALQDYFDVKTDIKSLISKEVNA